VVAMTAPIVHAPGAGESTALGTITFTIKADSAATQGQYSLIEAGGPVFATAHVHHTREEAFFVVEGRAAFLVGTEVVPAEPGSFLLVPRGTMHGFRAETEMKLLIVHSPGGFEDFFREALPAMLRGEFDTAARDALAERFELTYHDDVTF
jgi:mannose-6-phosphate isomerase-like protein (cupin superfamily)